MGGGAKGFQYHNPGPLCRLIGPKNEVKVIVNDEQVTALVDSGAQILAVSLGFAKHHGLPIWQLQKLLDFEGFGGLISLTLGTPKFNYKFQALKIMIKTFWSSFRKTADIQNMFPLSWECCTSKT